LSDTGLVMVEVLERTTHWITNAEEILADEKVADIAPILEPMFRNGSAMRLADFDPLDYAALAPDMCLMDVGGSPTRFFFRLIGTRIIDLYGIDNTGKYLDELKDEIGDFYGPVVEAFDCTVTTQNFVRQSTTFEWVDRKYVKSESIQIPLISDTGDTVRLVTFSQITC